MAKTSTKAKAKTTAKSKANTKTTANKTATKIPKLVAKESITPDPTSQVGIILGPIEQLLEDKESKVFKEDQEKFREYPIQFVTQDGMLRKGFLQDAVVREIATGIQNNKSEFKLVAIILCLESDMLYRVAKTCIAPVDCNIEWTAIQCKLDIL